jgi:membrane protein required for colicin V production
MEDLPVNGLDLAVIAVVLTSALLALWRGLVKEVLGILGLVGAAFATLYLFTPVSMIARQYIQSVLVAEIVTGVGIFVVTLVAVSILSSMIAKRVRESSLGPLDRTLGFLFGVARGAAIVSLAYFGSELLWDAPAKQPELLREAKTRPLMVRGADVIDSLIPASLKERGQKKARETAEMARGLSDTAKAAANIHKTVRQTRPEARP